MVGAMTSMIVKLLKLYKDRLFKIPKNLFKNPTINLFIWDMLENNRTIPQLWAM